MVDDKLGAGFQVSRVELIGHIPAQGTKLAPLLQLLLKLRTNQSERI